MSILIKNAQIVLRKNTTASLEMIEGDLGINDNKIIEIGQCSSKKYSEIIDLKGLTILPGIIDTQVHFREPGMTHKEDIDHGSLGALMGGVTGYFEMPNTKPPTTSRDAFNYKIEKAKQTSWTHFAFFVGASRENINDLGHLEKLDSCAGVKVFVGSSTGSLLVSEDHEIEQILLKTKRRIIFHSEDENILESRKHLAKSSGNVLFHPKWRNVESALNSTRRIIRLAQKHRRQVHILHVSTADEIEYLNNFKSYATVEVLPNHLIFDAPICYQHLGTLVQQNPPIREKWHQEALWSGIHSKIVDIMGSDHAPHTLFEKSQSYPQSPSGTPGVQTMLTLMLNEVHKGKLSLFRLVELLCEAPQRVFGLQESGQIKIGERANLTIVDLNLKKKIQNSWIVSKSKWTPFDGITTVGWPVHVLLDGNWALRDGAVTGSRFGKPYTFSI